MRPKIVLAGLAVMTALGGWMTAHAADRDDYYRNGYYDYPDRSHTYYYYQYPERSYTYYYTPDRSDYDYRHHYRDDNGYYGYGDPHRNYLDRYGDNRYDPYGIESHDTN